MSSHLQALTSSRGLRLLSFLLFTFAVLCSSSMQTAAASGHQLTVSPENLDFQMVVVGHSATLLFHIKNTGSTTLHVYRVSSSKSEFHLSGPSVPMSVAPSKSIEFRMTFEPTSTGKTSAVLEIISSAQAMVFYTLTGIGKAPFAALQLSPSSLNFGSQKLNSLSRKNITVQNTGDISLTISGVTVIGSGFGFSNISPGLSLAPKQQAILQVSFRPLSSGAALGKLSILSKSLTSAATLPLAGSGVNPSPPTSHEVHLEWAPSPSPVIGYRVYRGAVSGGPYPNHTADPLPALDYNDTSVVAGATYYYVVTAVDANGVESTYSNELTAAVPSSPAPAPIVYRSATLPAVSSGPTFRTFTYSGFPDTLGTILDATTVGDHVTFTVNVAAAGTYDIKLSYKQNANRGISQFAINGTNVSAPLDQYLAAERYETVDYGTFTFPVAGNYSFKFTILGKNASATAYPVSFDDFTLTPK